MDMENRIFYVCQRMSTKIWKLQTVSAASQRKNQNAVHRQNVDRMMKYVMAQFGYALLPRPENLTLNMA